MRLLPSLTVAVLAWLHPLHFRFQFDYMFFTGSDVVGKVVAKAAAEHLTPYTLELGGKSPVIIGEDADLKLAARRVMWGKCMNAGNEHRQRNRGSALALRRGTEHSGGTRKPAACTLVSPTTSSSFSVKPTRTHLHCFLCFCFCVVLLFRTKLYRS